MTVDDRARPVTPEGSGTKFDVTSTIGEGVVNDHDQDHSDEMPNGGYGWVIVGCIFMMNSVTWGINTTYGVYSSYYLQNNHFAGGSTFRYAWVGGLSVAIALGVAPIANWLLKRLDFRIVMLMGTVCVVLGQCLAGICTNFAEFLVTQGVVFGIGMGLTFVPAQPLLAHWFNRRLALAQGIGAAGSGFGGLILSNTTRLALDHIGVKYALIINGLISLVVLVPSVLLLRSRHKIVGARTAPWQFSFLWHPGFVWVWLWGAFSLLAYFIALYSLASFATSGLGLTQAKGAALQSILSAGQMIGRPLWGQALDKGGRINMAMLCYIIVGGSCLVLWLPAKSFGVLIVFAFVQGLTGGTIWSAATPVAARVVGVQDVGSALGMFWLVLTIPALVGQPIAVALLDYSRGSLGREGAEAYYISIGFCGGVGIVSAGLLYGAKRWLQGSWTVFRIT